VALRVSRFGDLVHVLEVRARAPFLQKHSGSWGEDHQALAAKLRFPALVQGSVSHCVVFLTPVRSTRAERRTETLRNDLREHALGFRFVQVGLTRGA
jgi:hypothetical protein